MSNTILVIGESGSGKSTSFRNLDHESTFLINVLDKPLPFRGYKKNYIRVATEDRKVNYFSTDNHDSIIRALKKINEERPDITTVIIDDFQYVMANEFMKRASERGFDKFTEIGQHAWQIINTLISLRENIDCYVLSHTDTDASGRIKPKTIGKMLDDKITIEGMFTIVLHALVIDGKYKFLTQNDGTHVAKSPMGMFDQKLIDNDLMIVKTQMHDYFNEDINQ
jgi:ABC-type dipeptide/oligopeptide/nickel transport system ATPase component